MERARLLRRHTDGRCLPCFALQGEPAAAQPHEDLRLVASHSLASGTREEFICQSCGQNMVRFLATQTSPPPSNRWRNEKRAVSPFSGSAAPLRDGEDDRPTPPPPADVALSEAMPSTDGLDEPMEEEPTFPLSLMRQ